MRIPYLKRSLFAVLLPMLAVVIAAKYQFVVRGWEILELNNVFTAVVSANVFLLGFLLAGVLSDFKEAEKLPSEIAGSLESIADDVIVLRGRGVDEARACLEYLASFATHIDEWLHKRERTGVIMERVNGFPALFAALEPYTQPNYIVRLKQEQSALRKAISRIDTIRDTSFVRSGYLIAEINSALLIVGLLLTDVGPMANALFFTLVITFLFVYMIALIKDLDNPFGFYENTTFENVSIEPIGAVAERLRLASGIDGRV